MVEELLLKKQEHLREDHGLVDQDQMISVLSVVEKDIGKLI
jgi:hypothetical protein